MAEDRTQEGQERIGPGHLSAEEEIRMLELRLAEKKRELTQTGAAEQPEKELFREVVREHIESVTPAPALSISQETHTPPSAGGGGARDDAVQDLVAQALSGSIAAAVEKAYRESPYLLDALHDRLVDEYYDKLVALRKIDAS